MTHEFWYLSRAAGITAYLLLFATSMLGIAMSARVPQWLIKRNFTFELHRFITLIALALSLFHAYSLLGDGFFGFSFVEVTVPFASPYRPAQVALGVLALWALAVVTASFYVRRLIGHRAWRLLHFLSFGLFAAAAFHGITAGTDAGELWSLAMYATTATAFVAFTLYRIQMAATPGAPAALVRTGGALATTAAAVLLPVALLQAGGAGSGDAPAAAVASQPAPDADAASALPAGERPRFDDDEFEDDDEHEEDHEDEREDDDEREEHEDEWEHEEDDD